MTRARVYPQCFAIVHDHSPCVPFPPSLQIQAATQTPPPRRGVTAVGRERAVEAGRGSPPDLVAPYTFPDVVHSLATLSARRFMFGDRSPASVGPSAHPVRRVRATGDWNSLFRGVLRHHEPIARLGRRRAGGADHGLREPAAARRAADHLRARRHRRDAARPRGGDGGRRAPRQDRESIRCPSRTTPSPRACCSPPPRRGRSTCSTTSGTATRSAPCCSRRSGRRPSAACACACCSTT